MEQLSGRSLAKWIKDKNILLEKDIVLLSCSDLESAQNLSNKLQRKIIASDGKITLYKNGGIESNKSFMEMSPGNGPPVSYNNNTGVLLPHTNPEKIVLGSGWRNFINELQDGWDDVLRAALDADLNALPELRTFFGKATNKAELAEAWRLLRASITETNAANALFKNPKALQALAQARKNPNLVKYGITDQHLASYRGWGFNNTGVSVAYDEVINTLDKYITSAAQNSIGCTNCEYLFNRFLQKNLNDHDRQAVYWIMEDVTNDASFFKGKSIKIEERIESGRVDLMIIDEVDGNHTWIEYKWYGGEDGLSRDIFLKQFVGRDLSGISDLKNLQWRLKGQKITKDMLLNGNGTGWLQLPEGLDALKKITGEQAAKILKNDNLLNATKNDIAKAFLEYFNDDQNFSAIFK